MSNQTRILFRAAVTFATAMTVLGVLRGLGWIAVIIGLSSGVVVGGVLYFLVRVGNWRLAAQGIDGTSIDVIRERSVEVALPMRAAFDACLEALKAIPKIRKLRENREAGEIDARTRMSWRSYGELVTIRVAGRGQDGATIHVRSEPVSRQKVDYGKSVENVELFLRALSQSAPVT